MSRFVAMRTVMMVVVLFSFTWMMPITCPASGGPETKTIFPKEDTEIIFSIGPWVKVNKNNPDELFCYVKHKLLRGTYNSHTSEYVWAEIGKGLPDNQAVTEGGANAAGPNVLTFAINTDSIMKQDYPYSLLLGGGRWGIWSGVPYQSIDNGESWYPLNICEHGPGAVNQNFKYCSMNSYGLESPTDLNTIFFGADSDTLDGQGVWVSRDGGRTILPNYTSPYYKTKTFCEDYPDDPFCNDAVAACANWFDSEYIISLNPNRSSPELPMLLGGEDHDACNWVNYWTKSGFIDAATGALCVEPNVFVDYPEGRFNMDAHAFFMEDGTIYAFNRTFQISCAGDPGGRCTQQCAQPGATNCTFPETLVAYSATEGGALIFKEIRQTGKTDCNKIRNIRKLGDRWLFFLDGSSLKSYDMALDSFAIHELGSSSSWVSDFDAVKKGNDFYVYYIKANPFSDHDPQDQHAELKVLHWADDGIGTPPSIPTVLEDFSTYWTGVRNFFLFGNKIYVGSWDTDKLFFSSDFGSNFKEVRNSVSSLWYQPAHFRYLKPNPGEDHPVILSLFSLGASKVTIDDSDLIDPKYSGVILDAFANNFPESNLCTTTFTGALADPKAPPGELWVWLSSDAGIWRNKEFNCEIAAATQCWDHVSGGYASQDATPPTQHPILPDNFGNYTYKLIFDDRDTSWKTVYAATKSGLWKGVEQDSYHWFGCQDNQTPYCVRDHCKGPDGSENDICGSDVDFSLIFPAKTTDVMVSGARLYAIADTGLFHVGEEGFPPMHKQLYLGNVTAIDRYAETPNKIVIVADGKLLFSEDWGETWCEILELSASENPVKQIAARTENGVDYLYYLTNNGYLKKTGYECIAFPHEPPQGFSASANQPPGQPQVEVAWGTFPSAVSYNLYRSEDGSLPMLLTSPTTANYTDLSVCRGRSYAYSVRANFTDQCYSYTSAPVTVALPTNLKVTNIQPNFGIMNGGTEVIISGEGFAGAISVYFGDKEATSFTIDPDAPDTRITAVSPAHIEGTVNVTVITAPCSINTPSTANLFKYCAYAIAGISPNQAPGACPGIVDFTGWGFEHLQDNFECNLGSYTYYGGDVIIDDPNHPFTDSTFSLNLFANPTGTFDVATTCETLVPLQFTFTADLQVCSVFNSVSPASLCTVGGETVTVHGQGFHEGTKFKIGGKDAPVLNFTDSGWQCWVQIITPPHHSGYADITASNPDSSFTLPSAVSYRGLEITGVSPQIIPADGAGHAVSVAFNWIGPPESENIHVLIDGIDTAFTAGQNGTITLTLTYQESGYHSLAIAGADSCILGAWPSGIISVKAGEIVVHPDKGTTAGGTVVDIYGQGGSFTSGAQVAFGALGAESAQFVDNSHLKAVTPRSLEGPSDVIITGGTSFTKANGFTFTTYAFTTNWLSGDSTVIDTHTDLAQDLDENLSGIQPMALTGGARPFGMSLSSGSQPGRELYIADSATGGLLVLDASNLKSQQPVDLQYTDEDWLYNGFGAIDVAVDSAHYAYIAHLTSGKHPSGVPLPSPPWPPSDWNPAPGGISIVDLDGNTLVDADGDPATTSEGAPPGYSRVGINLYPFSISILNMERLQSSYQTGDGYPGEYAVISGVGPQPLTLLGWDSINRPIYPSRPMRVGFIDLNPKIVSSLTPWTISDNPNYRKYIGGEEVSYRGQTLGYSDQGLDFSISPNGQSATVYAVNPVESTLYYFDFLEAVRNPFSFTCNQVPLSCTEEGSPVPCGPTDVVVEGASAYITNAAADSVAVCDISAAPVILAGSYTYSGCPLPPPQDVYNRYASAIDTRSDGSKAYTSDSGTNTVSVIDLAQSICTKVLGASDGVGNAPVRIAVQPVVTLADIARTIENALTFAQPQVFTAGPKQDILKRYWENIEQLQEINASPQAVLSQINDFQNKVDLWVANADMKRDLVKCIDLYRVAYLRSHPRP